MNHCIAVQVMNHCIAAQPAERGLRQPGRTGVFWCCDRRRCFIGSRRRRFRILCHGKAEAGEEQQK